MSQGKMVPPFPGLHVVKDLYNIHTTRFDDGRLSGMANLSWAKDAVLGAAIRDLAWDAANTLRIPEENGGVFSSPSSPMRYSGVPATSMAAST
jgi:hypothetical protein